MTRRRRARGRGTWALALPLALALGACGSSETSLLVIVESDLAVPDDVDALRLRAQGAAETSDATWGLEGPFPHSVRLVAGKDVEVELTVTGLQQGRAVASVRTTAHFVKGEEHEVVVRLGACQSCGDGGPDGGDGDADADADGDGDGDADGDADVWRPSNLPEDVLPLGADVDDVVLPGATVWNTETGAIDDDLGNPVRGPGEGLVDGIDFTVHAQDGGPSMGLWSFGRLEVAADATVVLEGTSVAGWIAIDEVVIAGDVIASAAGRKPGPGGGTGAEGLFDGADAEGAGAGSSVVEDQGRDPGGGGGGFGGTGGDGGLGDDALAAAGAGGPSYGEPTLVPLLGGSGGGGGGPITDLSRSGGGGGGGGLQIFSRIQIRIEPTGRVLAAGAGGGGGPYMAGGGGGGGGGSGGAILLEAPTVEIAGAVAANGGGGGGGAGLQPAEDGEDGTADDARAAGGTGPDATVGGQGGAADTPDGEAGEVGREGSGGGGAVGRVRLNTADGAADVTGVLSPPASEGPLGRAG